MNETKSPVKTLKRASPLDLGVIGVVYLLVIVAFIAAVPVSELREGGVTVAALFMYKVFGSTGERILSALIAASTFGSVMSITFAQSRVNQELAKDGVLPWPKFWASSYRGSPAVGMFLAWILSAVVIIAVPIGDAYNFVLDLQQWPGAVIDFSVVVGFFVLRRRAPELPRPFRCLWPVAAFCGLVQFFLMVAPFLSPTGGKGDTKLPYWLSSVVGAVVLGLAAVYWAFRFKVLPWIGRYGLEPTHAKLKDGTALVMYQRKKREPSIEMDVP